MKYILDFDYTLYDTDLFSQTAEPFKQRDESGQWVTPRIWDILDASDFFYNDTLTFLSALHPSDVTILTAWTPSLGPESYEFQKSKVERSGIQDLVGTIVYMEGDKGPYVRDLYRNEKTVFVDDRLDHLQSAKKYCPNILVAHMIRPGRKDVISTDPSGSVPTIPSLAVLHNL